MRDSLRVYVAGDDNVWRLVATNNMPASQQNAATREFSDGLQDRYEHTDGVSGYSNGATQTLVQELFDDAANFRQARIDLGPFAGNENVRVRFDFSTAGEARPDQSEIHLVEGYKIPDNMQVALQTLFAGPPITAVDVQRYTFDHGLWLASSWDSIPDGATLTFNGAPIVRFSRTGLTGGINVPILATDTAEQVANKVRPVVNGSLGPFQGSLSDHLGSMRRLLVRVPMPLPVAYPIASSWELRTSRHQT